MIFCFLIDNFVSCLVSCWSVIFPSVSVIHFFFYTVPYLHVFIFVFNLACFGWVWYQIGVIYSMLFFCVSLQIIKIFLMRKISIITIFFTVSLSAQPREIISLKTKLVLSYRIFYKFTVIFVTCWNLQIIKTTFIFFLQCERLYIRACTCSLILYALYCFKSFVYLDLYQYFHLLSL